MYKNYFKRLFDVFFSLLGLVIFAPIMLIVAVLVKIFLGAPIIFKQQRPGLCGKIFTMYKFRTMKDVYDVNGKLLSDADRLTKFGKFLRKSSVDELPELFNVLKNDMSLVGPRPLLVEYLSRYNAEQAKRHDVKPGITGWLQVNGRNSLSWSEKFKLDVWYVENQSFLLDIKILWLTVAKVFKCDGISQQGQATMEEFFGSK